MGESDYMHVAWPTGEGGKGKEKVPRMEVRALPFVCVTLSLSLSPSCYRNSVPRQSPLPDLCFIIFLGLIFLPPIYPRKGGSFWTESPLTRAGSQPGLASSIATYCAAVRAQLLVGQLVLQ